jgi:hypothetical protein
MPVTVSMNFMEIWLKRLWNRPLNEHALRVMGGGCDGKVSWLIFPSKARRMAFATRLSVFFAVRSFGD